MPTWMTEWRTCRAVEGSHFPSGLNTRATLLSAVDLVLTETMHHSELGRRPVLFHAGSWLDMWRELSTPDRLVANASSDAANTRAMHWGTIHRINSCPSLVACSPQAAGDHARTRYRFSDSKTARGTKISELYHCPHGATDVQPDAPRSDMLPLQLLDDQLGATLVGNGRALIPTQLRGSHPSTHRNLTTNAKLSLGTVGGGLAWHWHAAAFFASFHGRKRWDLASPMCRIPGGEPPPLSGELEAECATFFLVQQPSELLYVPENWWHLTRALEPSVGVSIQLDPEMHSIAHAKSSLSAVQQFQEIELDTGTPSATALMVSDPAASDLRLGIDQKDNVFRAKGKGKVEL
jgi:hypothetical protein